MDNSILFFNCFRNKKIKEIIFNHLNSDNNIDKDKSNNINHKSLLHYNSTTSTSGRMKYSIILDKLKSNHFIHFDNQICYRGLFNSNNNSAYSLSIINEILNQLYINHNTQFNNLSPLELSIDNSSLYSLKSCLSIYNNNNNNNNNNNINNNKNSSKSIGSSSGIGNNKQIKIEDSYRLHSLVDQSLYNNNNNYEITKYLISNSNNNKYSSSGGSNGGNNESDMDLCSDNDILKDELENDCQLKKQKQYGQQKYINIYDLNDERDVIDLIHLGGQNTSYSINSILNLISNLTNEKVQLIESLNLDIKVLLNQYFRKSGTIHIGCIFNKSIIRECINMYLHHPTPVNVILEKSYINDLDHAVLNVLRNIHIHPKRNHKQIKSRHLKFIDHMIRNGYKSLEGLVESVEEYLIKGDKESRCGTTKKESRYKYMGDYYIYYLLLSNKVQDIKSITFRPKSKFNMLLLYSFSVFNFSIDVLELFYQYLNYYNTNIHSKEKSQDQLDILDGESDSGSEYMENQYEFKSDFSTLHYYGSESKYSDNGYQNYLDYIVEEDSTINLSKEYWYQILKVLIVYHQDDFIQMVLNKYSTLQELYITLAQENFEFLFKCHFEIYKPSHNECSNESPSINKIKLLFQLLEDNKINHSFSYYQSVLNQNKMYIQNKLVQIQDHLIILQDDKKINNSKALHYFTSIIFDFISLEDVDYTIKSLKYLQEKYSSNNNNNSSKNNNNRNHYNNNSNILVNNLIKSICLKDITSVNKILEILPSLKSIEYKPITEIYDALDGIRELNRNGYLNQFKTSYFIDVILNTISSRIISKDFIMELVPKDNQMLIKCYENHFKVLSRVYNNQEIVMDRRSSNGIIGIIWDIRKGYFNRALNKLENKNVGIELLSCFDSLSLEIFIKFYPLLKKSFINGIKDSLSIISKRLDIFDFIWNDYYLDLELEMLKKFIIELLLKMKHHQLIEHVLKTRFKFIQIVFNNDSILIKEIHQLALITGQIEVFKLLRKAFTTFNFELDYDTFIQIVEFNDYTSFNYHVIEYLVASSLIPSNLKSFIGRENILKFQIKEFHDQDLSLNLNHYKYDSIIVSKSMFILIHSIIKSQMNNNNNNNK